MRDTHNTPASATRAPLPEGADSDTPMTRTYVGVVITEAVIIVLLWILGRMSS